MKLTTTTKDEITIIRIEGQLDGNTSTDAQNQIIPMLNENSRIVIDMGGCEYVSSSGLRVLMMIGKHLTKLGGKGVLARLSDEVNDVMEMTGFSNIFSNYPQLDDAIAAVKTE